jgi:hypothetical protein
MLALAQPEVDQTDTLDVLFRLGDYRMDTTERLFLAEKEALRLQSLLATHEQVCAHRYAAIESGMARMAANVKWLAISVALLALVVFGVATVKDIVRSGAGRIGVTITQAQGER